MKNKILITTLLSITTSISFADQALFDPFTIQNSHHLFVTGEFLLWQASEDNLEFAISNKNGTSTLNHATIKELDFEWNPGFRIGLGYRTTRDRWDLYADYMHIESHAHRHLTAPQNGALFPIWQAPASSPSGGYCNEASGHWRAYVDMADLELGRDCIITKWLSMRPFIGLKGGSIFQKYKISYSGGTAVEAGDKDVLHLKNQFWGVGIRAGADTLWGFGKGWGLFANGAFSALSGWFDVDQSEKLIVSDVIKVGITNHPETVCVVAELAMGVQWDRFFKNNRYHLGVRAGWEMELFTDQNQFFRFVSSTNPGIFTRSNANLALMGLSLGFRFDF